MSIRLAAEIAGTVLGVVSLVWLLVRLLAVTEWRRKPMTRSIIELRLSLLYLLALALAYRLFGDYPGRQDLITFGLVVLGLVLARQVALFEQEHRAANRARSNPER